MKVEKDNSQRLMMIALVLAVGVPWGILAVVKGGHKAFSVVPILLCLFLMIDLLPNYFFYRRCRRLVVALGGTILSHNFMYSKLVVESGGIRTDFIITRGVRTPTYISMTSPFKSTSTIKFWLRPTDCFDGATHFFDKMLDAHPVDKLLLDNKFMIAENTLPLGTIESILSPIKHELFESLKVVPTINLNGSSLVLTVKDYSPDDIRLSRYFRIIRETITNIQSVKID